ncbi:MAG: hypothetical protein IK100_09520 [Muribaculaceae bacterium]|nr:hypothetical protein [Muribaculaceae bacterium]
MRPTEQVAVDLGCKYIYDEWGRVNLHADKLKIGDVVVVETLPTNGQIDTTFAPIVKTSRTAIFAFLKHCDLDFEGAVVGEIIEEMLNKAKAFIVMLDATGEYEPLDGLVEYNSVIDFLDANMAGVRVTLELKELSGGCIDG